MKKLLLCALLSTFTFCVFAQEDTAADEEYQLRGNEKYGYIINEDGKKEEGIVKLMGTDKAPWVNQKKVKFIAKGAIDSSKKRQKFDKLKTDDLQEYVAYEDNGTERHFRLIKYSNTREGLMNQSGSGMCHTETATPSGTTYISGNRSMPRQFAVPAATAWPTVNWPIMQMA